MNLLLQDVSKSGHRAETDEPGQLPGLSIEHLPLHACMLEPHSFVLPAASAAAAASSACLSAGNALHHGGIMITLVLLSD